MLTSRRTGPTSKSVDGAARPVGNSFPEGKTLAWFIGGFLLCRFLTDNLLPAVGLKEFAHSVTPPLDAVAPYLLLPVCLMLGIQVWRHSAPAAVIVALGTLALHYFFFVRFSNPPSWLAVAVIVLGVGVSYVAYRGAGDKRSPSDARQTRRLLICCAAVYAVCAAATAVAQVVLEHTGAGDAVWKALPLLPSLIALAAWIALRRGHAPTMPETAAPGGVAAT